MNESLLHILHQAFFGGIAAVGFAVLFNSAPRILPYCFGAGVLALATRTIGQEIGASLAGASFFAALLLAIADKALRDFPSSRGSVLAVVGSIPMVPGSLAAKVLVTVFTYLRSGERQSAAVMVATGNDLIMLVSTLAAIGTALALPSLIPPAGNSDED
jgi:uncharacterized membrane protein YjjB (DUF3815 family)